MTKVDVQRIVPWRFLCAVVLVCSHVCGFMFTNSFLLNITEHDFFSLLINMKMPTKVGILIFISRDIFMLS